MFPLLPEDTKKGAIPRSPLLPKDTKKGAIPRFPLLPEDTLLPRHDYSVGNCWINSPSIIPLRSFSYPVPGPAQIASAPAASRTPAVGVAANVHSRSLFFKGPARPNAVGNKTRAVNEDYKGDYCSQPEHTMCKFSVRNQILTPWLYILPLNPYLSQVGFRKSLSFPISG